MSSGVRLPLPAPIKSLRVIAGFLLYLIMLYVLGSGVGTLRAQRGALLLRAPVAFVDDHGDLVWRQCREPVVPTTHWGEVVLALEISAYPQPTACQHHSFDRLAEEVQDGFAAFDKPFHAAP